MSLISMKCWVWHVWEEATSYVRTISNAYRHRSVMVRVYIVQVRIRNSCTDSSRIGSRRRGWCRLIDIVLWAVCDDVIESWARDVRTRVTSRLRRQNDTHRQTDRQTDLYSVSVMAHCQTYVYIKHAHRWDSLILINHRTQWYARTL